MGMSVKKKIKRFSVIRIAYTILLHCRVPTDYIIFTLMETVQSIPKEISYKK